MKMAHTTPSPGVSYAASVQMRPVMKSVLIQTEPLPAASASAVSLPTKTSSAPPKPTTKKTITPATSSYLFSSSTSTSTSSSSSTTIKYASAVSTTPPKKEKNAKDNNKCNFTTLEHNFSSHVLAAPTPSRRGSHALPIDQLREVYH